MGLCCADANERKSAKQNELVELVLKPEIDRRKSASMLGDFKKSVVGNRSFKSK